MRKIFLGLFVFAFPMFVRAQVTSLNGQTGATQTFANDTNVTISSSGDVHTLGWTGVLQGSRGGTGVDMSTFTAGSILFYNGSEVAESNSNLFWDDTSNILKLGSDINFANQTYFTQRQIKVEAQSASDTGGNDLLLKGGDGNGIGYGGGIYFQAGDGGTDGHGGTLDLSAGAGGTSSGSGGNVTIAGGPVIDGDGGALFLAGGSGGGANGNGGNIEFSAGNSSGVGSNGKFKFFPALVGVAGILDFDSLSTSDKTYTFQNASGTLALLEVDQEFSGINTFSNPVNNFISSSDSTVHIGADGIPGCIVMGDTDSSGVTYVTANNGVLSASSSPPGNCN